MVQQDSLVEYGSRRVIITVTCILCALLELVDTTIVNVALTDMKGNLGATTSEIGWVITAYAIGNIIVIPMTSFLATQFGRRNYFVVSVILFTVCSLLCGNATGVWELVIFRFIQGLGGGALLVTSQTIMTETYPTEKRSMALAIYGMGVIIGPSLGPPLGGYITDMAGWTYIFYINIPLGIIAALLALQFVKSPKYAEKLVMRDIDWLGIGLLAIFVGSLQYVLERGQDEDWFRSNLIITFTWVAILGCFFFVWRQLSFRNPVVQLRLLKNTNLRAGMILFFIIGIGLYGSTFIIPLYTQATLGWTATQAGLLMMPAALMAGLMMPVVGRIIGKGFPYQYLVAGGMLTLFIFCFWGYKIITPDTGKDTLFWMLLMRGVGLGLLVVPVSTLSFSTLKGREIADGAAFTGMTRQLGGSFGIAAITTLMADKAQAHRGDLVAKLNVTDPIVQNRVEALQQGFMSKGIPFNIALRDAHQLMDYSVTKQAMVLSYMDVFLYMAMMFLICIPFILIVKRNKAKKQALSNAID